MSRIGIMGGTFDPVHNAHLELALRASEQYDLDTVLFVPAGRPVRKLDTIQASSEDRLKMLALACEGIPACKVSTIEVDREGVTYTIDTLRELHEQAASDDEFFLILGEDAAVDLGTWKDSAEIAKLVKVLYAKRPGNNEALALPKEFTCYGVEMPERDISSSQVRKVLETRGDASALVPRQVLEYIDECGLYGQSE